MRLHYWIGKKLIFQIFRFWRNWVYFFFVKFCNLKTCCITYWLFPAKLNYGIILWYTFQPYVKDLFLYQISPLLCCRSDSSWSPRQWEEQLYPDAGGRPQSVQSSGDIPAVPGFPHDWKHPGKPAQTDQNQSHGGRRLFTHVWIPQRQQRLGRRNLHLRL